MTTTAPIKRRCAIYTRKSSEEGLEQDFNSLHAQREACEAYIRSQAGEGWVLMNTPYDDGGISGGTMDRPGLKRLLGDITAGLIDAVVVYKVDRLTRSLTDFAKIVETFDAKGVSFVSITQAFNTTTSMGRLTLNVLLSFAQFEREVTGERIRDKIAQSKAKGMWMAGVAPLGYDSKDRKLIVNESEAERVRFIFARYCALKSVYALALELKRDGVRSKGWITRDGRTKGDLEFSRGALYHLLSNRHYTGLIVHKDKAYPGLHPPIVSEALFNSAQAILAANGAMSARRVVRTREQAPLKGLLFDGDGQPLTPSFSAGKGGKVYRYYIGQEQAGDELVQRLPAPDLEALVLSSLRRLTNTDAVGWAQAQALLVRGEVRDSGLELVLSAEHLPRGEQPQLALQQIRERLHDREVALLDGKDHRQIRVALAARLRFRGGRTWVVGAAPTPGVQRLKKDPVLIKVLRRAHGFLKEAEASPLEAVPFTRAAAPKTTYGVRIAKLAFLAPDLQLDILAGRQPSGLQIQMLTAADIPLSWEEQRRWIRKIALEAPSERRAPRPKLRDVTLMASLEPASSRVEID